MKWQIPQKTKIYEALGTLADNRLEITSPNSAKVFSSSGNKFYTITYSQIDNAIMSNDNGSYWKGYLGYPSIAYLMKIGKIKYNEKFSRLLKGIKWKDLNQKNKNDFEKTVQQVKNDLLLQGINIKELETQVDSIHNQIKSLDLNLLGQKTKPPKGY